MKHIRIAELLHGRPVGETFVVQGWVRTRRDSKQGFSFIELNDGSCLANLQIIAGNTLANYAEEVCRLVTGCSLRAEGVLVASPGEKQAVELKAVAIEVYGWADPETYPLQKKRHSFEFLRTIAHLRPRTNSLAAVARVRGQLTFAIHDFFRQRGFLPVHTPIITGSDCEGAGEMFQVTTLDLAQPPMKGGKIAYEQDFFGRPTNLTVSGQLEAEVYALALGRVYTFGPTFRAENSNTSRHLAEFWMVEPEAAFFDLDDDIELATAFLEHLFRHALEHCREDLELFDRFIHPDLIAGLERMTSQGFARLTYTEAVDLLERSGRTFSFPVKWGEDLQSEHERYLTEEVLQRPLVVIDYPAGIKPFYMRLNDDGRTVAAMDILLPGIGEIIGGSQREERHDILLARIEDLGLPVKNYDWYLDLRRFGSVPHAGFGLGFERLIQVITGMANIRDVIAFPRTPGSAEF